MLRRLLPAVGLLAFASLSGAQTVVPQCYIETHMGNIVSSPGPQPSNGWTQDARFTQLVAFYLDTTVPASDRARDVAAAVNAAIGPSLDPTRLVLEVKTLCGKPPFFVEADQISTDPGAILTRDGGWEMEPARAGLNDRRIQP
jgi:hypothetical protein